MTRIGKFLCMSFKAESKVYVGYTSIYQSNENSCPSYKTINALRKTDDSSLKQLKEVSWLLISQAARTVYKRFIHKLPHRGPGFTLTPNMTIEKFRPALFTDAIKDGKLSWCFCCRSHNTLVTLVFRSDSKHNWISNILCIYLNLI